MMKSMLKIYNTLTGKKEVLKSLAGKKINIFVCGPTTYDFSHIGHARTYIFFDFLVKYLRLLGYRVFYLQNITDIDDKIIQRATELGITPLRLARRFEKEYLQDMKALGVDSVTKYARATEHINEIISQVGRLLEKGYGYKTSDGIYYDIKKFKDYGKLSGRTTQQAEDAISRIDESVQKRNKGDFALWKYPNSQSSPAARSIRKGTSEYTIIDGEPAWKSPWGWGRPGWHIEDTAITEKYFGPQYDIHGGARDLLFPHHEAEISQMEAISGKKPMVKYWIHTGLLTVKGKKMAKSLGNFITIRDFLKEYSPRVLRLFVLKSYYRSPIDYSEKAITQTEKELERIDEFVNKIQNAKFKIQNDPPALLRNGKLTGKSKFKIFLKETKNRFNSAMEDDLNTPKAIAAIFDLVNYGNKLLDQRKMGTKDAKESLKFLKEIDATFQFIFWGKPKKEKIPAKILSLVSKREKYRKQKNWQKADEIRAKIKNMGYWIEDTSSGPKIKPC